MLSYFPDDLGVRIKTQSLLPLIVTWLNTSASTRTNKRTKKQQPSKDLTERQVYNATIKLAHALDRT